MNAPRVSAPQSTTDGDKQALMQKIMRLRHENQSQADLDLVDDVYAATLRERQPVLRWGLYSMALVLIVFVLWASWAQLEEVTTGSGKVIPTSREQVIQSLESGILAEIMVSEGDTVELDQALLRIDDVRQGASVKEGQSKVDALLAAASRLRAESQGSALAFPADLQRRAPELTRNERDTFDARRRSLDASLGAQQQALRLANDELRITEPMAAGGYVSDVDVLRIKRTIAEAKGRLSELSGKFRADAAHRQLGFAQHLAGFKDAAVLQEINRRPTTGFAAAAGQMRRRDAKGGGQLAHTLGRLHQRRHTGPHRHRAAGQTRHGRGRGRRRQHRPFDRDGIEPQADLPHDVRVRQLEQTLRDHPELWQAASRGRGNRCHTVSEPRR